MTASHPSYQTDPRVDANIDALPEWQQAICRRLRLYLSRRDHAAADTATSAAAPPPASPVGAEIGRSGA